MTITLNSDYDVTLNTALLGYVGETNARPVSVEGMEIDGAERYVLTIDYGDGTVYEVDITGGQWTPTADILRSAQTVSCQIAAKKLAGDEYILLKKSRIFRLRIGAAIGDNAVPSPDVVMDALDRIDAIGRQVTADKATVADNAAQVATDKASVAADKADIVSMKLEISNTATKLDTEYNNLTSNYYTKELANSTFTTKTEINNTNNNVSQLKEDIDDLLTNVKSKNLLDKTKVTTSPYNYINPNGNTETYGNNFVTDYIPVESGKVVTLSRYLESSGKFIQSSYASICMFDADKNVKSGGDYNKTTCTIPNGVAFVRITLNKSYFLDVDSMVELTDDGAPTIYEPYSSASKKLTDEIIESSKIATIEYVDSKKYTMSLLTDNIGCSLPKSEYFMTVGIEESWYTDSFATPKGFFVNMYSGSQADRHDGKYTFSNVSSYYGNNAYLWNLYDMLLNLVKNEANTGTGYARNCKSLNLQDCSLLCIGDSTVDHDVMTAKIKSFFTENGKTVTLLGTLGDGKGTGNNNEGRAGWTTSDYFTNKTYDGVVNPFYNPSSQTFDFAYYMRNHNYSSVDFVAIQLGINDLYNFDDTKIIPTWENIKTMIDSIHAFNPSVKVILNLPTTPNADQSKHSVFEPLYRNRVVRYCDYATTKAKELYPTTRVRVSYNHLILNPDTDIRDNVHPTNGGYEKMGLEVCNQINCWQNS